jgi:hypothetical protein
VLAGPYWVPGMERGPNPYPLPAETPPRGPLASEERYMGPDFLGRFTATQTSPSVCSGPLGALRGLLKRFRKKIDKSIRHRRPIFSSFRSRHNLRNS